jgi:hypothetical protein
MKSGKTLWLILLIILACNHIETGENLQQKDIILIQQLGLLEKGETIFKFYSEDKAEVAGNFFTNNRIATYWIDETNKTKDSKSFAFYENIKSIDTVYNAGLTYSPNLLVKQKDGSTFRVSVNGSRKEIKAFFEDAIAQWSANKIN